jgi:tRNA/tmRNA/rRNA uracil-C5-methylase (TrmA/RlmC/RlmD family)
VWPGECLIDAYCGSGFFSKQLVSNFSRIQGIEWSEAAVRTAKETATDKESYIAGSVEAHLATALLACDPMQTTLLLNPLRKEYRPMPCGRFWKTHP